MRAKDWKDLEVKECKGKGRGVFAKTKSYLPGDTIFLEGSPFASALNVSELSTRCHYCWKLAEKKLSRCSKCQVVKYCSRTCQRNDWKTHKLECASHRSDRLDANNKREQMVHHPAMMMLCRVVLGFMAGRSQLKLSKMESLVANLDRQSEERKQMYVRKHTIIFGHFLTHFESF